MSKNRVDLGLHLALGLGLGTLWGAVFHNIPQGLIWGLLIAIIVNAITGYRRNKAK